MPSDTPPQAIILAGPNGSGKSTCAQILLPSDITFINADLIAQEISGQAGTAADIGAGRLLLQRIDEMVVARKNFALETTLATVSLKDRIQTWKGSKYQVHLVFFWLLNADLAVERVAERVRNGGHDVPENTIRRRFESGLRNFFRLYSGLSDTWRVYDNSGGAYPRLIAAFDETGESISQPDLWKLVKEHE